MVTRRRMMVEQSGGQTWPVVLDAPMDVSSICNGGTISFRTDWRSSGYIAIPAGATKVRWKNSSTGGTGFRCGLPDSDTQTSGIAMLNNATVANNAFSSWYSVGAHSYVYISRTGKVTSAITIEFRND